MGSNPAAPTNFPVSRTDVRHVLAGESRMIEMRWAKIVWANSSTVDNGSVGEVNAKRRMELFAGLTFR